MKCPTCGATTYVIRTEHRSFGKLRRHHCKQCDYRFTTHEVIVTVGNEKKFTELLKRYT